jgi:D-alanine-D-alanine ligase
MLTEKKIGVIAGGVSAEREVSLKSGEAVFRALKQKGYNAVFIDADSRLPEVLRRESIEIAFLVLHGGWGEDGSVQGMLEVMGIPYTGSGVLASAVAMDKVVSKKLFMAEGLKIPPFMVTTAEKPDKPGFSLPWVVKPAKEGSSVGVSIVEEEEDFIKRVNEAARFGKRVIVEKYIKAKEIHVGILGEEVLGAVEVRPKRRFYDYTAKYTPGETEYILPPELDQEIYEEVKTTALRAHLALGCTGATRVDLLVTENAEVYVLEVNTIPGMTETSLLPKIAKLAGYDFPSLIEAILEDALKRL